MRQHGYLTIGLVIALAAMTLATVAAANWARTETEKRAAVEGRFAAFKQATQQAGEKAEKHRKDEIARQAKENEDATKRWNKRVAAADARADELCKRAGLSAGCRDLPPIPSTARPPDDAARDQRLLEVLRHAEIEVGRLLEFQEWQRRVGKP